jgi:hypothetical protein
MYDNELQMAILQGRRRTMTTSKPHGTSSGPEDTRLQELMRADAAAALDDDLDDETPVAGSDADERRRASAASHAPSQVYSIRVPVDRLEQVRRLASQRNLAPTAMLRQWVLAQLDTELGNETPPATHRRARHASRKTASHGTGSQHRDADAEKLEAATAALIEVAASLTKALSLTTELLVSLRPAAAQANAAASPLFVTHNVSFPVIAWHRQSFMLPPAVSYLGAGLNELQSAIEHASSLPGIAGNDLYTLYEVADEELPTS